MTTLGPFESVTVNISTHVTTELKSVRTDITEKLEPLGEKVDRILEVTEGLVEFVNGNCKTLERVLDQANAGVSSGPVSVIDVGVVLNNAIREEGEQTRWLIERAAQETRWFTAQCTMVVLLFIFALFALKDFHALWTPVFSTTPPVPPVCVPCRECVSSQIGDWVIAKCYAHEWVKNARNEWVRISAK